MCPTLHTCQDGFVVALASRCNTNLSCPGWFLLVWWCAGVSNGLLQQWPKVHKGVAALQRCFSVQATASTADQPHHTCHSQSGSALASSNSSDPSHCNRSGSKAAPASAAAAGKDNNGSNAGSGDLPWHMLFDSVLGDTRTVGPGEELPLTGTPTQVGA